ncbi:WD repeat-containing protein 97-like [Symsagittifera roscoffensis]|uniref:WD repeat-containing protein 97-like n=1 Tax=Symsagittifera roscoffensis TaxID=84072 RepID=UPI00307B4F13
MAPSADAAKSDFSARNKDGRQKKAKAAWHHIKDCITEGDQEEQDEVLAYRAPRESAREKKEKTKKKIISHGMQYRNSFALEDPILSVIFNETSEEYIVLDETNSLSFYNSDGKFLFDHVLDDELAQIVFMDHQMRYVGLMKNEEQDINSTLVLYSKNLEVLSKYHEQFPTSTIRYNPFKRMLLSVGYGNVIAWALHYEDTHLVPEAISSPSEIENAQITMLALEHNAGYQQKVFAISENNCFVFEARNLELKQVKRSLHVRNISSVLYFNPAKFLLTGSTDGSIKAWDENWCVKMVFIGHNDPVTALSVYPNGPFVVSSSSDNSIRVWSLETSDESAIIDVHSHGWNLVSYSGHNTIAAIVEKEVFLYTVEDLYSLYTSVGEPVKKITKTTKYFDYRRLTCSCEDGSVRIVCPNTGNVLGTVLLNYEDRIKDSYFISRLNYTYCLLQSNEIVSANMTTNPATVVERWSFTEQFRGHKISCFCIYEHIGGKELLKEEKNLPSHDVWKGLARAAKTTELERATSAAGPDKHENPVMLFVGRDDGEVCLIDHESGEILSEVTAHEMSNITCIVANPEYDQLLTAGTDKVVKIWKVTPDAEMDPLVVQFPFFFPGTPTHITCLKNKMLVAYQDSSIGMYASSVQTQERNKFEHVRSDDHTDKIISVAASTKMKLFATAGEDETIRIWSDHSRLIRVLKLNAPIYSVEFANDSSDLVVGIGDHLYRIYHTRYFTKSLLYKALTVGADDLKIETPTPYDESRLQSLDMVDVKRLKAAHCSEMNYINYEDKLPPEEQLEIDRELENEKTKFYEIAKRDAELEMLRNGQYDMLKKSKRVYNERVNQIAFKKYLAIFFQHVKVDLPKLEDSFNRGETSIAKKTRAMPPLYSSKALMEDSGFFPTLSKHPGKELLPVSLSGYLPNSVALKNLYPEDVLKEHEDQFKPREFTAEEIEEMEYYNRLRVKDDNEDDLLGDDTGDLPPTPPAAKDPATKSGLMEKMEQAQRTPSPTPEPEKSQEELDAEERERRVREQMEGAANKEAKEKELIAEKKSKPVRKFVSRPEQKSPEPLPPPPVKKVTSLTFDDEKEPEVQKPPTPLPDYITKNRGQDWYEKFFPNLNERTFPKPWYPGSFAQMMLRYIKTCEIQYKAPMVDYLKDLHQEWDLTDMRDVIIESVLFVLNKSDGPTGETVYGRLFFQSCLRLFVALKKYDFEVVVEAMTIYLEKDAVTKKLAIDTLRKMGVMDPQKLFYKYMDSWNLPVTGDLGYKRNVLEQAKDWLNVLIRKLSEQVEYVIDELKCGNMLLPGATGKKFQTRVKLTSSDLPEPTRAVVAVLDRIPGNIVDHITPIEAINYYTECELQDFFDRTNQDRQEMLDPSNRKTVLVLPKVPVDRSLARIGELKTSQLKPRRETTKADAVNLSRANRTDAFARFTTHINLPLKNVYMNPFGDEVDEYMYRLREQQPILLMLKSNQKYFVPESSVPPPL